MVKQWDNVWFWPGPLDVDGPIDDTAIRAVVLKVHPNNTIDICLVGYEIFRPVRLNVKPYERALDREAYYNEMGPHFDMNKDF